MSEHEKWTVEQIGEWVQSSDHIPQDTTSSVASNAMSILEEQWEYKFQGQLSYEELSQLTCNTKKWSNEEIEEFLKNDVIKEAYLIWSTVRLTVEDGNTGSNPWITSSDINTTQGVRMSSENPIMLWDFPFYPQNISIFSVTEDGFDVFSKTGMYVSYSELDKNVRDECIQRMEIFSATQLENLIWNPEVEEILIKDGVRVNLKNRWSRWLNYDERYMLWLRKKQTTLFEYEDAVISKNENELDRLVEKTKMEYQWGLSDEVVSHPYVRKYFIDNKWLLFGYFALMNGFRDEGIDKYFESEMKKRWVTNDQLAEFICSKTPRKHLEEWDYDISKMSPEDAEDYGDDYSATYEERKAILDWELDYFVKEAQELQS